MRCFCLYLAGLVGLDVRSSDHQRNSDVKLIELPLIQRKRELTCRRVGDTQQEEVLIGVLNHSYTHRNVR